ncbi:DUF547 domain-containing protein [Desulfuromonas versatilis]|uniref:DUF547 domain-containing protein n=1 Tax=Desulfuromonas versatilis TaxID=2802975 RepID=A0ABM8HXQ3_9BACT|nr:DUF547 domain-containing protein [Desulfuromonas versatilis]BCR05583.1 DUF547 domain-containing protein [Desulfuromonas versatilis]
MITARSLWLALLAAGLLLMAVPDAPAAPRPELWPRWQAHDPASNQRVNHAAWGGFLKRYLVTDHPSGIHRLRYREVSEEDRQGLASYLEHLQQVAVSTLNREEQKAYWINLYNALTVKVVLDHYPVDSIRDIDISPGFFSDGPWDAQLLLIEGERLSLNDIEHRILRPVFVDNRVHYALNCASLGCPNLQPRPFSAANLERLLEEGARAYVNHPRGVRLEGERLVVSSIYEWFQVDFGGSVQGVLQHLIGFADPPLGERLRDHSGGFADDYDWALNE